MSHIPGHNVAADGGAGSQHDQNCDQLCLAKAQKHRHRKKERTQTDQLHEACRECRPHTEFRFAPVKGSAHCHDITYEYDCIFEKLVEELKPYDFVVNCRGNLVNLRHIEKIKGFNIYLDNGKELQIAQKRSSDFREEVNKFLQRNS